MSSIPMDMQLFHGRRCSFESEFLLKDSSILKYVIKYFGVRTLIGHQLVGRKVVETPEACLPLVR